MGICFGGPDKKEVLSDSRDSVKENATKLKECVLLCEDDALKTRIEAAYDKVSYMVPTADVQVNQIDKKIANVIGDIKIALSRGKDRHYDEAQTTMKDLEVLIERRYESTK